MNTQEWIDRAIQHREVLTDLVSTYHPSNYPSNPTFPVNITAPNAESASNLVRDQIRSEVKQDPKLLFVSALEARDFSRIYLLLSDAWFGVPESTSCWRITGFSQCVDLLEDPPEDQNDFSDEE